MRVRVIICTYVHDATRHIGNATQYTHEANVKAVQGTLNGLENLNVNAVQASLNGLENLNLNTVQASLNGLEKILYMCTYAITSAA